MSFSDRIAGWFIKDDDIATAQEVAAGQRLIAERQHDEGLIDAARYADMRGDIEEAGTYLQSERDKANPRWFEVIPKKWIVVGVIVLGIGLFIYFGGGVWIRSLVKRKTA